VNGRDIHHALSGLGLLLVIAGLVLFVQLCGCKPEPKTVQNVENGAAVAQYDQLLAKCQEGAAKLPQPEQFPAYIQCEKALSRQLCLESPELQATWTRCNEVLP
jgi:hypothetical protein